MSLNASYNLEVFDSLKCILCKAPFVPHANHPLSPRKLGCGLAMCNGCFEREKAARNHREHRCDHGNCFHNTEPAHFLIDILSQDSLKLSTRLDGYYLVKPFEIPSCPYCGDKYSNHIAGKKSFVLNCNHMICTECYQSCEKKFAKKKEWKFTIECPTCRFVTNSDVYMRKDQFQSFLFELPKMSSQLDQMRAASQLGNNVGPCTKLPISDTNQRYCEEPIVAIRKVPLKGETGEEKENKVGSNLPVQQPTINITNDETMIFGRAFSTPNKDPNAMELTFAGLDFSVIAKEPGFLDRMRVASHGRCDDSFELAEKALTKIQQSALNAIQADKSSFQNLYREFFELERKLLLKMQNSGSCTREELKEKQQKRIELIDYYNKINEENACHLQVYEAEMKKLSQMLDE